MTAEEAEKIVQDYGGAVASLREKNIVLPLSALPYSKTRIRYAFYAYIERLVQDSLLTQEYADALVHTYALLNTRFRDNAEKINSAFSHYTRSEKARNYIERYGGPTLGMPSIEDMNELTEFLEECSKKQK